MKKLILILILLSLFLVGCQKQESDLELKAKEFCDKENVAAVVICDDNIRVISSLLGGGSTIYRANGSEIKCPVVSLEYMSEGCKKLLFEPDCVEKEIC